MTDINLSEFVGFPKIARLRRPIIVTEKIDGTNGQIYISETGTMLVGSKSRWITPANDNHGFARWAYDHVLGLLQLGPGRHFGEWWGSGIQRGYGLTKGEKRFSLFNVSRWCLHDQDAQRIPNDDPRIEQYQKRLPACVGLVPVLAELPTMSSGWIRLIIEALERNGSEAAPGFMDPEGIVIYHTSGNVGFKQTIKNDEKPKGKIK